MEAISIKKVTAVVAISIIGALAVDASANEAKVVPVKAETLTSQVGEFSALIKQFDKDSNGLLSEEELKSSKKSALVSAFTKIDKNADLGVSEEEFNQYLALASK
ncbi:hypothetical protein tinsulaeT_25760 [Thalassotalea insulae]|uniref:EF-hand domain-containing protein n=1 Tax=Thalassotalea insulae TaxID=2056778 RepID=A0ABQ6GYE8_9GAMM|nr:hypothetical protein [Thalassotalea insulae]GLX79236.1 hypothetical protein tinsulaeT_25760 [Thalassotalea insulae]